MATLSSFGQNRFSPTVVIMYPHEIVAEDSILTGLKGYEKETVITDEIRKNYVQENLAENWKIIRTKELEFIQKQDFFSALPFYVSSNLTYKVYDYHDNLLIYPIKKTSRPDHASLKQISTTFRADWVVNPVLIEMKYTDAGKVMIAHVVLYNSISNRIFLDKTYTVNANNPGGQLSCNEGSWQCTINNVVESVILDLFDKLEKNRKYWSYNE